VVLNLESLFQAFLGVPTVSDLFWRLAEGKSIRGNYWHGCF